MPIARTANDLQHKLQWLGHIAQMSSDKVPLEVGSVRSQVLVTEDGLETFVGELTDLTELNIVNIVTGSTKRLIGLHEGSSLCLYVPSWESVLNWKLCNDHGDDDSDMLRQSSKKSVLQQLASS